MKFLFIDLALIMPIAIFSESCSSCRSALAHHNTVGWADPAPTLSRKRPTADLVSRKVLTPLLGHIVIVILAQLAVFETIQMQPWSVTCNLSVGRDMNNNTHTNDIGSCPRNWISKRATSSIRRTPLYSYSLVSSTFSRVPFSAPVRRSESQ